MKSNNIRRPVKNFLLKKRLQASIIISIVTVSFLTSTLTTMSLAVMYKIKSAKGSFFYMSNNIMNDLELQSLLGIVLPALIISQIVTILIALGIGLFSSRRVAVPVYKLEKWAEKIKNGKLKTRLAFRKDSSMKDLVLQCNALTDKYKRIFTDIDTNIRSVDEDKTDKSPQIKKCVENIKSTIENIDF